MTEPEERYDHKANNITGTHPIDWENDLVPIGIWKSQQAEIERLRAIVAACHEARWRDLAGAVEATW